MSAFDENFGEGSLKNLISTLKFNGIEPKAIGDQDIKPAEIMFFEELILGQINFEWDSNSFSAQMQIQYSESNWIFISLSSNSPDGSMGNNQNQFLGFLCLVLTKFAKEFTSAKYFMLSAVGQQQREMFLKSGFLPLEGNLMKSDLYEYKISSKVEEYGTWADNGKDPELEPAWRKEV